MTNDTWVACRPFSDTNQMHQSHSLIEYVRKVKIPNGRPQRSLYGSLAPNYLRTLLQSYIPSRSLRSETGNLLIMPKARRKLGCQSFAVAAPKLWNDLPVNITTTISIVSFRSSLKTHLFKLAYAWFVQYHHFTNCCFYLIYNYVQ